uniref:Uncharacterized protein n=1 Tax=Fagus sylvatica TaxID=28930 RepID=A0A2N9J4C0_FAGSY
MGLRNVRVVDLDEAVFLISVISVLSSFSEKTRNGLGFGWASVSSFRLEPPAWWLTGEKISARNGLGLRFEVGNAGVVVAAWGCDLGVVVAWACRSRRGGGLGLPILRISAWVCRSRPRLAFSLSPLFRREICL